MIALFTIFVAQWPTVAGCCYYSFLCWVACKMANQWQVQLQSPEAALLQAALSHRPQEKLASCKIISPSGSHHSLKFWCNKMAHHYLVYRNNRTIILSTYCVIWLYNWSAILDILCGQPSIITCIFVLCDYTLGFWTMSQQSDQWKKWQWQPERHSRVLANHSLLPQKLDLSSVSSW